MKPQNYFKSAKYLINKILLYILPLGIAITLCLSSTYIQSFFKVPGVSVIISTLASLVVAKMAYSLFNHQSKSKVQLKSESQVIENNCDILSDIMLTLFYIIIGTTLKLTDIISVGPPAIILIIVTLFTHFSVLGVCSYGWNKMVQLLFPKFSSTLCIDVDTAIIARYTQINLSTILLFLYMYNYITIYYYYNY